MMLPQETFLYKILKGTNTQHYFSLLKEFLFQRLAFLIS